MKCVSKIILTTLLLAVASVTATASFNSDSAVEVIIGQDDGSAHGSGVYIGNGYLLTAGHVARDQETLTIKRKLNENWSDTWQADVVWIDAIHDIALLKIKSVMVDIPSSKFSCAKPKLGDDVDIVGWPADMGKVVSRGYIGSDEDKRSRWKNTYVVIAPVFFGNSGGPVFNQNGEVIGLIVGILQGTSLSVMTPLEPVCNQLPKQGL